MKTVIIRFEKYGFDITGKIIKRDGKISIIGNKNLDNLIISCLESPISIIGLDLQYKKHNINGKLKIYDTITHNIYNGAFFIIDKLYKEIDVFDFDENSNSTKKLVMNLSNRPLYPLGFEVNAKMQLKIEIF